MDVKHTSSSVDERAYPQVHSCFHLHDYTYDTTAKLSKTLYELTPRERALIRPYMVIGTRIETTTGKRVEFFDKLLLDTGSLDGNYIGRKILHTHPELTRKRQSYRGVVYMADNKSHSHIKEKVLLEVEVQSLDKTIHNFSAWFCVLEDTDQFILGYPSLAQLPHPFLHDRLDAAFETLAKKFDYLQNSHAIRVPEGRAKHQKRRVPYFTKMRKDQSNLWELEFSGRS